MAHDDYGSELIEQQLKAIEYQLRRIADWLQELTEVLKEAGSKG